MVEEIRQRLIENADESYRQFHAKLIPTVPEEKILGVRTPVLRQLAKEFAGKENIDIFLNDLPHRYYDENNLHGFILARGKNYAKTVRGIDRFLPYVDNWATCDLLRPACFTKNRSRLRADIDRWLQSEEPYIVRFGIEILMTHFLDEDFSPDILGEVASIDREEYYVKMMVAWFFATALAKQWSAAVPYIETKTLEPWIHNKTIQKAVESYRLIAQQKQYLKSLKIKPGKVREKNAQN
ncbi:MAG: DNA alkylation repair protein [Clostridia bacterium]|nr:DNA alkylation repair protein [Clostridia bacterium]